MPKKKEKKNGNDNVEFDARQDITDARKVKRFVTEHFKETHRTIARAYRGSKAERVREAFNLTELYESRRIRAVANSLPDVWRRYGAKYPGLAVENEWAMLCSIPALAYDELDFDHNLCLGAALWMLDTLKDCGQLDQALALLPRGKDETDVDIPQLYDPSFSKEILCGMLFVIQNRYGRVANSFILPAVPGDKQPAKPNTHEQFCKLVSLLPQDAVSEALERFRLATWEWCDTYLECANRLAVQGEKYERRLHSLTQKLEEMTRKEEARTAVPSMLAPLAAIPKLPAVSMDDREADRRIEELEKLAAQADVLEEKLKGVDDEHLDLQTLGICAAENNYDLLVERIGQEAAEKLFGFSEDDPFETCFALLVLLEQDDDLAWLYSAPMAVLCTAANQLPWAKFPYEEEDDNQNQPSPAGHSPRMLDAAWYLPSYADEKFAAEEEGSDLVSLAQLVYGMTGALLPRDMQQYDFLKKHLRRDGLTPSKIHALLAVMAALGAASRQIDFAPSGQVEADEQQTPMQAAERIPDAQALRAENSALQQQADALRRAAHAAEKQTANVQKQLEELQQEAERQRQELADLRALVFHQQQGTDDPEPEKTSI
ncbi:hypothetical protein [uncultured Gemmiger sp.]|uniref:coiled-coil domain-containing protein n=1 Tax=uncultured Gemmiger sp. TaxID=1623490 RepID=UPI0025F4A824|nr:hypothetical protein [uncultured Gemmiger sp.]